jgi:hypothetical protein
MSSHAELQGADRFPAEFQSQSSTPKKTFGTPKEVSWLKGSLKNG